MLLNKVQFVLPLLLIAGSQSSPVVAGELGPSPGWHYLWTLCVQEPSSSETPALCDEVVQGEDAQAIAVSSVFYISSEYDDELETFRAEAGRRLGFEPPIVLAGPFSTFKEAEAEMLVTLKAKRSAQNGLLAVTAIPMKPEWFDNEPNDEERSGEPALLPPVMESFKGGSAQLWRDDDNKACGLRLPVSNRPSLSHSR